MAARDGPDRRLRVLQFEGEAMPNPHPYRQIEYAADETALPGPFVTCDGSPHSLDHQPLGLGGDEYQAMGTPHVATPSQDSPPPTHTSRPLIMDSWELVDDSEPLDNGLLDASWPDDRVSTRWVACTSSFDLYGLNSECLWCLLRRSGVTLTRGVGTHAWNGVGLWVFGPDLWGRSS